MTQEKIAKALNISRRTVARALSGDPKISPDTRKKVLRYCESAGYKKNRAGSLLASPKRTVNVYLLASTNEKYFAQTEEGIYEAQKQLGENKIRFNIYSGGISDPGGQVNLIKNTLGKDKPDGIIIIPIKNQEILKILKEYDYRNVVTIDKPLGPDITHIGSDYKKFGEMTAQMMQLARKPEERLLIVNTNGDGISSEDFYMGFMSELEASEAVNYDTIYINNIRENMDEILKYKDLDKVKYIFAPRFLTEIIAYMDGQSLNGIKYAACSINDILKEHIKTGKVISGVNINYHLHGYLAAKAVFNIINSDWKPVHYITNSQIIIKGNLDSLDDRNVVKMHKLFNIF